MRTAWPWCLWPGLAQLWFRGTGRALVLAVGFGLWLNVLVATSLVWREVLPPAVRAVGWAVAVAVWGVSAAYSWRFGPAKVSRRMPSQQGDAIGRVGDAVGRSEAGGRAAENDLNNYNTKTYVDQKGAAAGENGQVGGGGTPSDDPPEAVDLFPGLVTEYLKQNWFEAERLARRLTERDDVDAELMLAGVLRRTGRMDEARGHLTRLARDEAANRWRWEVMTELAALDRAAEADRAAEPDATGRCDDRTGQEGGSQDNVSRENEQEKANTNREDVNQEDVNRDSARQHQDNANQNQNASQNHAGPHRAGPDDASETRPDPDSGVTRAA